jgi:hypothetical protein
VTAEHVVLPDDEARHTPDGDELWNESYYCDFVRDDGSMGGWIRLGLYPNRQVAWWTTWIVWPDGHGADHRPGVCSVDYAAPVPPGDSLVSESPAGAETSRIEVDLRRPLEEFRIASHTQARIIDPPERVYADGEQSGTPAQLDLDLTWTTDGVPYHYDLTTRYEIPCSVSGTVTVDGETFTVDGQGQRDHSWGVRDWWAFGWCWCSMRLADGTRVHLADIRTDIGIPVFFGYIQQPGQGLVLPATSLSVTEDVGPHGFPSKARIDIAASGSNPEAGSDLMQIGLDVTPVAFGPVLLRNDDGRTSRFPRAMVTCRTDDGRTGAGWIEWNQPDQPDQPDQPGQPDAPSPT